MTGLELKNKLKATKVSQVDFASLCGVSDVQVSKWVNGHSDVPVYAQTIIEMRLKDKENDAIEKLTALANIVADGHYTICKFTTNYRVGLGTPADRDFIDKMAEGSSVEEAIANLLAKVQQATFS